MFLPPKVQNAPTSWLKVEIQSIWRISGRNQTAGNRFFVTAKVQGISRIQPEGLPLNKVKIKHRSNWDSPCAEKAGIFLLRCRYADWGQKDFWAMLDFTEGNCQISQPDDSSRNFILFWLYVIFTKRVPIGLKKVPKGPRPFSQPKLIRNQYFAQIQHWGQFGPDSVPAKQEFRRKEYSWGYEQDKGTQKRQVLWLCVLERKVYHAEGKQKEAKMKGFGFMKIILEKLEFLKTFWWWQMIFFFIRYMYWLRSSYFFILS